MQYRRTAYFVLLFLGLIVPACPAVVSSQEIEMRPESKPDSEKTHEELEQEKALKEYFLGHGHFLPSDLMIRAIERTGLESVHKPPATFIHFGEEPKKPPSKVPSKDTSNMNRLPNDVQNPLAPFPKNFDFNKVFGSGIQNVGLLKRTITIRNNYYFYRPIEIFDLYDSKDCFYDDDLFVLGGYVTAADERWFMEKNLNYVLASRFSPKKSGEEQIKAAALTAKRFSIGEVVVFDGLPHELVPAKSHAELKTMGLRWDAKNWRKARPEIDKAMGSFTKKTATKKAVEDELRTGSNNILFLIAHSDSDSIFFPGLHGGSLSIRELDQIRRDIAPNRTIVLLSCGTGQVNGNAASIAETLVKNNLAIAVLATAGVVDAAKVSVMLRDFQENGLLRKAFPDLRGIVQLEIPLMMAGWNISFG